MTGYIPPKDYIKVDGAEFVWLDVNSGSERRFPTTSQGGQDLLWTTSGYVRLTPEAHALLVTLKVLDH